MKNKTGLILWITLTYIPLLLYKLVIWAYINLLLHYRELRQVYFIEEKSYLKKKLDEPIKKANGRFKPK